MSTKLVTNGYLSDEEMADLLPTQARLQKGPVGVLECIQDIPCNPCEQACSFQAISIGKPITSLPVLDEDKCIGCGACIPKCPGLAIFVVDCSRPGEMGTVQLPYEYYPLPEFGQIVDAVDRKGFLVAKAVIDRVNIQDHTAVLTILVPKAFVNIVRGIRLIGGDRDE
ncbi:MAG: 4Fe-4S ferredoxin iron-sulfur binding protein [Firmicutes bacterium]|nr:4Fe-4S ferredoxin iron-sulfur binding protein [Bacillota bacterium]